ncbi:MAG: OmpA family protein [Bacteroidota bacterium]
MKSYVLSLMGFFLVIVTPAFSQLDKPILTSKDSTVASAWVLGLGINIVDDSATPFGDEFLNIKDTWHAVPYPSRISIGRFFKSGIGLEAIGTYNRYKEGKIVNGAINDELREYFGVDGKISYDLNKLIGYTGWFDPYIHVGGGYTSIGDEGVATGNAGFGFNTWFSDRWGLNLNTMGKWGLEEDSNKHIQHSAAVVYRFGIEKELTKKGVEKLALLEAMEKEQQRVNDSIAAANRAKEEAALAERLAQERERQRLAEAERARLAAEKKERDRINGEIAALGNVYFAFDSYTLNTDSKKVLDGLAQIIKKNPGLTVKIASGTDSRGPASYNKGLSQRRVDATKKYLLTKMVKQDKVVTQAYGEENLLNDCDGSKACSEKEHSINRRSEFFVESFQLSIIE